MEKKQNIKSKVIMGIIAAISLIMALFPIHTLGADTDNDGFDEAQGLEVPSPDRTYYGLCQPNPDPEVRVTCLDPNTKDLFVALTRAASNSNIPQEGADFKALEFISKSTASPYYGLGITIHYTKNTPPPYQITPTQRGARIREVVPPEDTAPNSIILGDTPTVQNPNLASGSTVYTKRILNYITSKCSNAPKCVDYYSQKDWIKQSDKVVFEQKYIKHNLAHEAAHNLNLAPYNAQLGSNHYKSDNNSYIMNVSVYTKTDNNKNVTWYIGDQFTNADRTGAKLK